MYCPGKSDGRRTHGGVLNSTDVKRLTGMAGVFIAATLWGTTGTAATFAPDLSPLAIGAMAMGGGGLLGV